ncbi:TPA: hypothetical protein OQU49_004282 [Shigella flexneri]|nr:hypothetical protein [Shigella flexneri]
MSSVTISADAASRVAGFQIGHPNTAQEFTAIAHVPSMRFTPSSLASTMDMMPAIRNEPISELVRKITEATLTAAWWDESGTLLLVPATLLRATEPVQTVNTGPDITSLSWEDSLLSVRSSVEVKWKRPVISKARQHRLELWRGAEESVVANSDPVQQFVQPESEQEWFGVDRTLRKLDDSTWGAFNDRAGSYSGLRYEYISGSNAGNEAPTTSSSVSVTTENLYTDSLIITTAANSIPANIEGISATSTVAIALRPQLRGQALPVVRGMGRADWVDDMVTVTAGSSRAGVLDHDLSYWGGAIGSNDSVALRIANFLAPMVTNPQPTITDMGVIYDPRRQIGDVITVRSDWIGISLRVLIVGLSESHGGGSTQSLTVRVISATNIRGVSYDDLAAAWGPSNYAGLQAAWSALNYSAMESNPLEGAPA